MAKSSWEEKLAQKAKEGKRETAGGGGGNQISTKNRRFTLGSTNFGRTLQCVIVDFVFLQQWYKSKYKEGKAVPPNCYALGVKEKGLRPHENSERPQSKDCKSCPWNEWGSGKGKGKACASRRRLALIHADDATSAADIAEAEIAVLSVAPTSLQNWGKFVSEVEARLSRPVYSVVVELSFDNDQTYIKLDFEATKKLGQSKVEAIEERIEEARALLMQPWPLKGDDEEDEPKRKKKGKKHNDDEEDDEDADEDTDDDDEGDSGRKRSRKASKASRRKRDRDEDEEDDSDDDDDDDKDEDNDSEDDDDSDEESDKDDERSKRRAKNSNRKSGKKRQVEDDEDEDDEDDEEDDERRNKDRKRSRFG